MTVDTQISNIVHQVLGPQLTALQEQLAELEAKVQMSRVREVPEFLTRKQLAKELSVSERYITDNPGFQAIEKKIGGRILYPWAEVRIVINNSKNLGRKK